MELQELKTKSPEELSKILEEKEKEVATLRLQVSLKQLKNVRAIREARKIIARILTLRSKTI